MYVYMYGWAFKHGFEIIYNNVCYYVYKILFLYIYSIHTFKTYFILSGITTAVQYPVLWNFTSSVTSCHHPPKHICISFSASLYLRSMGYLKHVGFLSYQTVHALKVSLKKKKKLLVSAGFVPSMINYNLQILCWVSEYILIHCSILFFCSHILSFFSTTLSCTWLCLKRWGHWRLITYQFILIQLVCNVLLKSSGSQKACSWFPCRQGLTKNRWTRPLPFPSAKRKSS